MAPTLATGTQASQVQETETAPNTPNGKAPLPVSSSTTPGCTPTTTLLRFDGGYEVSMCYRTPEGVEGQAKAGLYASAESGLLWFFSRENAEVLVKVLNGCAINGHRWVFTAPVTTLEFDLWVTSPAGKRWTHGNRQGETAATRSDVAAFACADEPDAAADLVVSGVSASSVSDATPVVGQSAGQNTAFRSTVLNVLNRGNGSAAAPNGGEGFASSASSPDQTMNTSDAFIAGDTRAALAAPTRPVGPQTETNETISDTPHGTAHVPATSPDDSGCTPTTGLLHFDGGYEVSMCYRTPDTPDGTEGVTGQAKAGLYASAESGLLWFFSRDNAEVLVKVLNGCAVNGYRWVFVAPVTTLEFDLRVTSPGGERWNHANTQGVTAATKSDVAAFACADEPEAAPDLIVSGVSVSDENPVVGQIIELRATVLNRGDDPASPTTIRYYTSDDSTISTSDNFIGSDTVAALSASATESRTFRFTAPSTPGTFYLGACIEPFSAESDTDNNCSAAVRVVVEDEPEPAPDLTVSSVTVSDATPAPGQTIEFRATVQNRGDGPASQTTLRYYRSSDSTITTSDNFLGSDAVVALSASATESATFHFSTPSTPGTFYLGACIDSVPAESDTGNNCSDGVRVVVEDEPDEEPAPDLIVPDVSVSDENPVARQTITLRATVRNRGDGPASATRVRFYRSSDSTISESDLQLGADAVPALPASATESRTLNLLVAAPGTFYLGACINPVPAESDTGNNCSAGVLVTVDEPLGPDLTVSSFSVSDENPIAGDDITLHATVLNGGDSLAGPTPIHYISSDDPTIDRSDDVIRIDAVAALAASATESVAHVRRVGIAGTYYLGACVISVPAESDTSNNCSESALVVVRPVTPDLTVSSFSVSDATPDVGDDYELHATVLNGGRASARASTIRYYVSDNSTIDTSDDQIGSQGVISLAPSQSESKTFLASAADPGTFYVGACVDTVSDESDEDNNCSDGALVTVE